MGGGLYEIFGKLEDGVSKFSNLPIFGRNQMNEPIISNLFITSFKLKFTINVNPWGWSKNGDT